MWRRFAAEVKRKVAAQVTSRRACSRSIPARRRPRRRRGTNCSVHSLLAGAGIVLLLALLFGSGRNLLLILANLPFALVGGVLAVFATRRLVVRRLAGRLRHALRHHHAQFHHDDFAFRASGERGRHDLGTGGGHARRVRTADADSDDGDGDRPRPAAAGASAPARRAAKSKARWPS